MRGPRTLNAPRGLPYKPEGDTESDDRDDSANFEGERRNAVLSKPDRNAENHDQPREPKTAESVSPLKSTVMANVVSVTKEETEWACRRKGIRTMTTLCAATDARLLILGELRCPS